MTPNTTAYELAQVRDTINAFIKQSKSTELTVELTTAAQFTGKGRLPKDAQWTPRVFAPGIKFRLEQAAAVGNEVFVTAVPAGWTDSTLAYVRIPLKSLTNGDVIGFDGKLEAYMQTVDMNALAVAAEQAAENEKHQRWAAMQQERGDIFGSW